jgi:hypothetical protein
MAVAGVASMTYYFGHTATALCLILFFFTQLTNCLIHYLSAPLPRFVIGAMVVPEEQVKEESSISEEK